MKYIFVILLLVNLSVAQIIDREFRGAWIASVANLDWPSSNDLTVEEQKTELIELLNKLQELNFNAVLFQVRPECDALYNSSLEPWSYWLTGIQGKAPEPYYDPLEFAIEEAHKRGLELHAWLNPYRAERVINNFALADNHIAKKNPEYILEFPKKKILNPGMPQVRSFVTSVVMDIVKRYNVDGIHFDDYFYPYPTPNTGFNGVTKEDSKTFEKYNRGYKNIDEWRRSNVDLLIEMVHDSIKAVKPYVRFGVSPFGIWKDGIPHGVKGFSAFDKIYCDPLKWMNDKTVDYIAPQLYWPIEGDQSFDKLYKWWISESNGVDVFPGVASYRILDKDWPVEEISNQLNIIDSTQANNKGYIFFRAEDFQNNPKGLSDEIVKVHQKNLALATSFNDTLIRVKPPKIREIKENPDSIWIEIEDHQPNDYYLVFTFVNKNKCNKLFTITSSKMICLKKEQLLNNKYISVVRMDKYKFISKYGDLIKVN